MLSLFFSATCDNITAAATQHVRDVAQLGRALRSGRRGRWFKSSHPDHGY
jgi:hypothetical protein